MGTSRKALFPSFPVIWALQVSAAKREASSPSHAVKGGVTGYTELHTLEGRHRGLRHNHRDWGG